MSNVDNDDRRSELDRFAEQSTQRMPSAPSVVDLTPVTDRVFGAQKVAVYRDETRVLSKLAALAAAAGDDWYYRFPVQNKKTGTTDWIEGPSIKLANDLARIYGNCDVDIRVTDIGDSLLFYARFSDLETGYSLTRPFQQRKSQTTMNTSNSDRQRDIVFQIGASKAIRNVITNALQTYADYAFEQAKRSLVDKIGKDLPAWRDRAIKGINNIPVPLANAERVIGRAAKDWLAPDVARIIAMMKAIADGMATADETFPAPDKVIDKEQEQQGSTQETNGPGTSASKAIDRNP